MGLISWTILLKCVDNFNSFDNIENSTGRERASVFSKVYQAVSTYACTHNESSLRRALIDLDTLYFTILKFRIISTRPLFHEIKIL